MERIRVRAIVALAVGVALIALGAVVFLMPRSNTQIVALEPIQATPQRVPVSSNPPAAPPSPPATVKSVEPLTPRTGSSGANTSSVNASSPTPPAVDPTPEPSERPPDPTPPSPPPPPSSRPTTPDPATAPAPKPVPTSLPVRQTAQGWGIQAGAFKTETNAAALRDRLLKAGLAARVDTGSDGILRVIVGAFASADAARATSASVTSALK